MALDKSGNAGLPWALLVLSALAGAATVFVATHTASWTKRKSRRRVVDNPINTDHHWPRFHSEPEIISRRRDKLWCPSTIILPIRRCNRFL